MELGGNSPLIVLGDADLDAAVEGVRAWAVVGGALTDRPGFYLAGVTVDSPITRGGSSPEAWAYFEHVDCSRSDTPLGLAWIGDAREGR